jgi:argininosuccinate synthase
MTISFDRGEPSAVNNESFANPVELVKKVEEIASTYGIGRGIHIGDTIIGIKGRVGFEAAAPLLLINAHETLEKHVLTKWQIYWKEQLANWYGMMLHEGYYLDPVMRDIESYLEHSQERVSGEVLTELTPKRFEILGINSPNDLMKSDFGQYGESFSQWSGEDVKGFAKILSVPMVLHNSLKKEKNKS